MTEKTENRSLDKEMVSGTQPHAGTIDETFFLAIDIEHQLSELYGSLSDLFSNDRIGATLFQDLKKDELKHYHDLNSIHESLSAQILSSDADEELQKIAGRTKNVLDQIDTKMVKNLDEALELVHQLEFSEVNETNRFLTSSFVSAEDRRDFILSEITVHQKRILDFRKGYRTREDMKKILPKRSL